MQGRFGFDGINCWADFEGSLVPLGKKAKGDAFEALTKWFFNLNEVHASQYDEVWQWAEVPERVKESLNLPERDLGVDLLLRKGEEYHAVQCKYHTDRHSSVTFKQVATFLSLLESNDHITLGYICSSANGMSANLQKVTQNTKQIQRVLSDTWAQLDAEFFDRVRSAIAGEKPVLKPYKPRKHQKKAIADAVKHFEDEGNVRGKLIFPCGAGKSLTGYWIAEALKSRRTLIAVPSLSLVKQTIGVYLRECAATGRKVKWLCVCSDEGIGRGGDVVMYHNDLGIPCETNIGVISQWLQDNADEDIMVFTTYQSGRVIAEAAKANGVKFDLGLFDEAHKTVGAQGKLFSHLLFDENVNVERRVFMTATERFYAGSKEEIVSMDDGDVYGETFVKMTFKEAIEQDLLTDYKVITIEVQESDVADFIRDNNLIELNAKWGTEAEARSMASMLALRKAMKKFPIRNAVSFHGSIDKAKRSKELQTYITDSFDYAPIDTYTVSGKIPTTKRNDIVQEFARSEGALITNARCLTEGVDVPNIDCIVFADPRRSKVDIVQALGRALRKKEGKGWGYVVLPVIYDQETGDIDNDNFEEILAVVQGLASNDERIIDYFKSQQRESRKSGKQGGNQFELQVISNNLTEDQIEDALRVKLWDRLIRYDWMPFEEAREFVHSLTLSSQSDWVRYCRDGNRPANIPSAPDRVYEKKGWQSWGDWFGTGYVAVQFREFRPFPDARDFVRSVRLANYDEWRHWAATEERPDDIPSDPRSVYEGKGWTNLGDWLGTGNVASKDMFTYLPFIDAREFARRLNLKSQKEWAAYAKSTQRPKNIPAKPGRTYKTEYKGIGDWLGTGFVATRDRVYRPFNAARNFARSLNLKTSKEWFAYCKTGNKPEDIPTAPNSTYRDKGWAGMGDWLGNEKVANHRRNFRSFEDARDYARSLKLTGMNDWRTWSASGRRPSDIPGNPRKVYKGKGWKGMADWLGTGNLHPSQKKALYCDFETAREYVRSKQFESSKEFQRFCKSDEKPVFLPPWPSQTYRKDWSGWGDFLGNGQVAPHLREYRPFQEARLFARALGLKNSDEWRTYSKSAERPDNIPASPNQVYKDLGWSGMGDWLGTGIVAPKDLYDYLPFEEAREFVRGLKLKNQKEWKAFAKPSERPTNIPSNPRVTYKNKGWINLGDWLGTGSVASFNKQYRAFEDARAFVRSLGLKSSAEWFAYCKSGNKPVDIPAAAHSTYRDKGWNGMGDWLGTGRASNRNRTYREFEEARDYARSLNLGGSNHWARWSASGERPQDIPGNPNAIYKEKGWAGWSDWLGTGNLHPSQKKALYCDFLNAREYVVAQGFRSVKEFERFCKSGQKPDFLAPFPYQTYQDEWRGWPYFLGKE